METGARVNVPSQVEGKAQRLVCFKPKGLLVLVEELELNCSGSVWGNMTWVRRVCTLSAQEYMVYRFTHF